MLNKNHKLMPIRDKDSENLKINDIKNKQANETNKAPQTHNIITLNFPARHDL
ncbi:hypothetical protein PNI02_32950 [Pseudoalteromonas nigrifaciens]|uniref:Orphan protein n=1 Tax=Pseudoalteromonas translucida (strain TAC 125) TaxID=326442 RepID=Q3IH93_PSET1|nr:hypothetical protein PNI02_32950 [Pseudoalteromonas nigrifaciens]CAI86856.1 putative orphan protein [Pseudoalteromonas translucida]|tara:strand:+ start:6090 stop:6248 length:159 start_codon:yes stop_codon:yes gene_type:complete